MKSNWAIAILVLVVLPLVTVGAFGQDNAKPEETADAAQSAMAAAPPRPLSGAQLPVSGEGGMIQGMLVPSLSLSEIVTTNSTNTVSGTALSGNLAYSQASAHRSFSLNYSGGGMFEAGGNGQNTSFHNFSAAQTFAIRRWTFTVGDALSYLPESPVGGGLGIPGMGQLTPSLSFSDLNPNLLPSQSILTFESSRLSNSSFGQAQYNLTRKLSVTGVTSYGLLHYLDNSLLDSHQLVASTGMNYQMRRSQAAIQYSYSRFGYDTLPGGATEAHMAQLVYSRVLIPNFTVSGGFGPQWIKPQGPGAHDRTTGSGFAGATYSRRRNTFSAQFAHSYNNGSGLLRGAVSNTFAMTAGHQFRHWSASTTGSYGTNSGVLETKKAISRSVGGQLSRSINQRMSVYWSYTYEAQSASNVCLAGACAFDGNQHVFGFGFFWHPRPFRIGNK